MLLLFSIVLKDGSDLFTYETIYFQQYKVNNQQLSEFTKILTSFAETTGSETLFVGLSNMILYLKTYESFSLRLLFQGQLPKAELDRYFEKLSSKFATLKDKATRDGFPTKTVMEKELLPILEHLIEVPIEDKTDDFQQKESLSRITIAGLANAGKTSIRRMFFENWTRSNIKDVKPTIGLDISSKFQEIVKQKFIIMDCGGQKVFIKEHLNRQDIWQDIAALIYIVDIQNIAFFEEARDYLSQIWEKISRTGTRKPQLVIFLHKYDILKRKSLGENIKQCMFRFREFIEIAMFHLTTIEDSSSNIAMIKTLYVSTPEVILKKLFEEEFLVHFENSILPQFSLMYTTRGSLHQSFAEMKEGLRRSAVKLGLNYSLSLQEVWLKYLLGEWSPGCSATATRPVKIVQKGHSLYLKVPNWMSQGIPRELTDVLLDGMLEGIFKPLHLESPEIIEQDDKYTIWKAVL
ncbi:MAG: ADP-ribosylation factor-like protein [Candidatus Odinarchaeota archaeon]